MKSIRTPFLLCLLVLLALPLHAGQSPTVSGTRDRTIILVRHAEKSTAPADDPALSAAGSARAQALARRLAHAGVGAIVTTQWTRTRATAAPLAAARSIVPIEVSTSGAMHVEDVVAKLRKLDADVVLVVGHSNTVPAIILALGGPAVDAIGEADYDRMLVLELGDHPPRLVDARY